MNLKIAILSGKGGTGKTFVATNLARALEKAGKTVNYLDCDVEAPNGHLFLKPQLHAEEMVKQLSPASVNPDRCRSCGRCADVCRYNAIAMIKDQVLFFPELCHNCGACTLICPENAINEEERTIGTIHSGVAGKIAMHYGMLRTGEGGMSARLIRKVKSYTAEGFNLLDSPPGTTCPVVETIRDVDKCILVTDPTPFAMRDLKLAVNLCRKMGHEPGIIINRSSAQRKALDNYCRDERLDVLGEIPDDRNIAEHYSRGQLVYDSMPLCKDIFKKLAKKVSDAAVNRIPVHLPGSADKRGIVETTSSEECQIAGMDIVSHAQELVIVSGKGGTGKTSLAACFSALNPDLPIADCDVDAADLHLILKPEIMETGLFSGGELARIDLSKCSGCGACMEHCRFEAVMPVESGERPLYIIRETMCEGCGVCGLMCPENAIYFEPAENGRWMISRTRFGMMSHADLLPGEENSGKLVTLVRENLDRIASTGKSDLVLIDGSPGTGCPVIASVANAAYVLIVTEPTVSGIHDLRRIQDLVDHFKIRSGVLINKADINPEKAIEIKEYVNSKNADYIGELPYDNIFVEAQIKGLAVSELDEHEISTKIKGLWSVIEAKLQNVNVFPPEPS